MKLENSNNGGDPLVLQKLFYIILHSRFYKCISMSSVLLTEQRNDEILNFVWIRIYNEQYRTSKCEFSDFMTEQIDICYFKNVKHCHMCILIWKLKNHNLLLVLKKLISILFFVCLKHEWNVLFFHSCIKFYENQILL